MAITDTFYFMGDFSFGTPSTSEETVYTSQMFKSTTSGYTTYIRHSFDVETTAGATYTIKIYVKSVGSASWGSAIKTISLTGNQSNYVDISTLTTLTNGGYDVKVTLQTDGNMVKIKKLLGQIYKT